MNTTFNKILTFMYNSNTIKTKYFVIFVTLKI